MLRLVVRVKKQLPFVALSSGTCQQLGWMASVQLAAGLSLVCGALVSTKTYYQSRVIDLVKLFGQSQATQSETLASLIGAMFTMQVPHLANIVC